MARLVTKPGGKPTSLPREIAILITTGREMRSYNKKYKRHDFDTDVLTFGSSEIDETGDIVISRDMAAANARELGHSLKYELLFLAGHALLHLAGWNDATKNARARMHVQTERILESAGAKNRSSQ